MSLQYFEGAFKYRSAIMGLAMLSIIFFHQNYVHFLPFPIFHRIGYWGVEIFLFLSGMGMVNALQRYTLSHAYERRFHRILPSCMVIGTGKYLSFLLIGAPLALMGEKLHMGWWSVFSFDLWFIYAILAYYILTPVLFIAIVSHPKISLLTILGIHMVTVFLWKEQIGHDWFNPLGVFVWIIDRLPVFCIGMYLTVYQEKVDKKTLIISILFLLISICCCLHPIIKRHTIPYISLFLTLATPSMIWLCIIVLRKTYTPLVKLISFIGTYTLEIYLIHEYLLFTMRTLYQAHCNFIMLLLIIAASCAIAHLSRVFIHLVHTFILKTIHRKTMT